MAKRNKAIARKLRAGRHTYSKTGKKPCAHCQDMTRNNRAAAQRGAIRALSPLDYET